MSEREPRLISAVHLATQKLSSATSVDDTLKEVLQLCVDAAGADGGTIYIHDPAARRLKFRHVLPEAIREKLPFTDIADDFGIAGEVFGSCKASVTSQAKAPTREGNGSSRAEIEEATQVFIQNMLTAPLMVAGMEPIGVVQLINKRDGDFDQQDLEVIETVGAVSAMAYINSTLREQASRAASLMGMGKVSHDIGNLASALHSNLLFLEPMLQGLQEHEDASPEIKSYADLIHVAFNDLKESIDRIVGYSRLISDISAGRQVRPVKKPGRIAQAVADAAAYLEPEARRNGVAIRYEIEDDHELCDFDPQFVFRIVQNLVGNAIKAVRESLPQEWLDKGYNADDPPVYGEVWVRCKCIGDRYRIEVTDSGPGMPQEVVRRILAGNAISQWSSSGGSGWGTKIVLELANALGGEMDIVSEAGSGATFSVSLPRELAAVAEPAN